MLRQFSTRRILGTLAVDWLGTLAMLSLAAILRARIGELPTALGSALRALEVRVGSGEPASNPLQLISPHVFLIVAAIWPGLFSAFSVYDGRRNGTLTEELFNVSRAVVTATVILAGMLYLTYQQVPRILFLIFCALDLGLLLGSRAALWAFRHTKDGRGRRRGVLVIGAGPVGRSAVRELAEHAWPSLKLVGYVDDDAGKRGRLFEGLPVLGTLDEVAALVAAHKLQDALVALPLRAHERLVSTCRTLQSCGVRVHVIPDLFALSFPGATLDGFGGIPVIALGRPGVSGWQRFCKRAFDVLVSVVLLATLWPLMAALAILIRLDSPGPAIFRQERIGKDEVPFTMLKFRTMREGADEGVHRAHITKLIRGNLGPEELCGRPDGTVKMERDPRVTRVGRVLRRTSLDELPQLLNVLRGQMSLVGPRPEMPYALPVYKDWYRRRFACLPGITGWWQVKGRNRVSYDEMIRMDIYYVEHMSFWLDLRITLLTLRAIVSGKGAA